VSLKTKAKRAEKEAKRFPSRYVRPVKFKPRELLWSRYKKTGLKYDPFEPTPSNAPVVEAAELPL